MKKVNFLTMAAVALMTGFAGCSNDEGTGDIIDTPKGNPTSMQLVISAPKAPTTYAPDANASPEEVVLVSVKVLIYEQGGTGFTLEQVSPTLTMGDFDPISGSDAYQLKEASKISTTTGVKKIYVAMNYAGTLPAVGTPIGDINTLTATLTAANDLSNPTTTGFAMFSTAATDATLVAEDNVNYSTANKKDITVKRLVAKISVQEHADLRDGSGKMIDQGGELTNLQFALNNVNKTSYVLQNLVGASPNIVVQDKNWSSYLVSDFFTISSYALASTEYQAVDASTATVASGINPVYAPENTAQTYDADGKNLTFVSVRAQYTPGFFCDEYGDEKTPHPSAPVSFWTVTRTEGNLYYFDVEADATAFANTYTGSVKSAEYVNGLCYWRGYLNMDGAADASITGSTAAKFDVLRNVYYKTVIKKIKAPGYPTDQGKVTETTSLLLEVTVQPWQSHTDNWEL